MEFFYRCKGSVSIFLVIILVPVIVVCSVFVDVSRMKLAKGLVNSAGDLTLTTAMSYYDLELNDYYGLLASSQSKEEFLDNSQKFFEACMVSQGIETTDARQWAETLRQIAEGDSDIVDLLQIEVAGEYSLEPVEGANLANAAMLKNGIVDFMKYRAPIELLAEGSNVIDKFTQIGEVEEIIPVETKLQDEKQDYYEAEYEVLKLCGDIYIDFQAYYELGMTEQKLKDMKAELDKLEAEYRELHTLTVKNLFNGENKAKFNSVNTEIKNISCSDTYSNASAATLRILLNACESKMEAYDKAENELTKKLEGIPYRLWHATYYDVQYWIQMEDEISKEYKKYIKCLTEMYQSHIRLKRAYEAREQREAEFDFVEEKDVSGNSTTVWSQTQEAYDAKDENSYGGNGTIEVHYNSINASMKTTEENLKRLDIYGISNKMESISEQAVKEGLTDPEKVTTRLKQISQTIDSYEKQINKCDKLLKEIYKNLGDLEKAVKKYDKEYLEWKGMAEENSGYAEKSDIVETDLHEISVLEGEEEPTGKDTENQLERVKINLDEVQICRNRVNNVRALFGSYMTAMDAFKYGGKNLKDIKKYKTLKDKSGIVESKIVLDNSALEDYAKTSFEAVFEHPASTDYHNITDNNNPEFTVNQPNFYEWLHKKFDGKNLKDKQKAKGVLDKLKEKMEQEKKKNETEPDHSEISTNEVADQKEIPSKLSQGSGGSALGHTGGESVEEVGNTTSLFKEVSLKDILTAGRDNLYGTAYIMNMLTYDTLEKENLYKMCRGEVDGGTAQDDIYKDVNGTELSPGNCQSIYQPYKSKWEGYEDTTFTANKTLTNKMKNKGYNFSFGNEVEYIIYGGKNSKNKLSSYGTIFGIRYAMNIGPVFRYYWNKKEVVGIAGTISTATAGIIPVSLIKLIICLGVTAAETAVDISYLKAGMPVLFLKTLDDLFLQFGLENLTEGATELVGGFIKRQDGITSKDLTLFYSDYLTLFLFIAISMNEDAVYLRTGDVIQCNMGLRNEMNYRMQEADVYYALTADIRVKPMMLALPWPKEYGSNVLDNSAWNTFQIQQLRGY